MRALLAFVAFWAIILIGGWVWLQSPAGIQARVTDSVVKVIITEWDKDAKMRVPALHGSGSFIDWNGSILTAAHLVRHSSLGYINYHGKHIPYACVAKDKKRDLAILMPIGQAVHSVPLFLGQESKYGDKAYVVGFPGPLPQLFSSGYVIGWTEGLLIVSAPIAGGVSGGPILSPFGTIVGIIHGYPTPEASDAWQGYTYGPYISGIKPFVEAWKNGKATN